MNKEEKRKNVWLIFCMKFLDIKKNSKVKEECEADDERRNEEDAISVIHCGVVGNIQAFHVWAPGSIPGDGTFLLD